MCDRFVTNFFGRFLNVIVVPVGGESFGVTQALLRYITDWNICPYKVISRHDFPFDLNAQIGNFLI